MVLHLPSTLSLLLPPPSTQSFPLLQLIPLRLLRPRLLILLLLPLPLPLLRGRGVRLDSPMDLELPPHLCHLWLCWSSLCLWTSLLRINQQLQ